MTAGKTSLNQIKTGDVIYVPFMNELILVRGFTEDMIGQTAIQYADSEKTAKTSECKLASAWIIFERGVKLGAL